MMLFDPYSADILLITAWSAVKGNFSLSLTQIFGRGIL